jgi:hypothetical protein
MRILFVGDLNLHSRTYQRADPDNRLAAAELERR